MNWKNLSFYFIHGIDLNLLIEINHQLKQQRSESQSTPKVKVQSEETNSDHIESTLETNSPHNASENSTPAVKPLEDSKPKQWRGII